MPGLLEAPLSALYEMVNLEALRLGWTPQQVAHFAHQTLELSDPAQFQPRDWINLCYKMRKL